MLDLDVTTSILAGDGWELRQALDETAHYHLHVGTLHAVGPAAHVHAIAEHALDVEAALTIGRACGAILPSWIDAPKDAPPLEEAPLEEAAPPLEEAPTEEPAVDEIADEIVADAPPAEEPSVASAGEPGALEPPLLEEAPPVPAGLIDSREA